MQSLWIQKGSRAPRASLLFALDWLEHLEATHKGVVNRHHGTRIVKLPAIVRGAEDCNQLPLGEELIPILNDLMCAANQIQVVLLKEAGNDIGTKYERHPAIIFCPTRYVLVWVGPQQVAAE